MTSETSFCGACGTPNSGTAFCPSCGTPVDGGPPVPPQAAAASPAAAPTFQSAPEPKKSRKTKRKVLAAGVGLVILVNAFGASETPSTESAVGAEESAVVAQSDKAEKKASNKPYRETVKTVAVNEPLSLTGTTYTVTGVRTAQSLGDEYLGAEANGTFVVLDLTLVNEKDEPATIMADAIRIIGNNGSSYSTSDDAFMAVDDQFSLLDEIQPGLNETGTLVYDLPPGAISGARLEVSDLFSDEKGRVKLGL